MHRLWSVKLCQVLSSPAGAKVSFSQPLQVIRRRMLITPLHINGFRRSVCLCKQIPKSIVDCTSIYYHFTTFTEISCTFTFVSNASQSIRRLCELWWKHWGQRQLSRNQTPGNFIALPSASSRTTMYLSFSTNALINRLCITCAGFRCWKHLFARNADRIDLDNMGGAESLIHECQPATEYLSRVL